MQAQAKSTHLTSSLFYKDTAGTMDEPDPTKASADANLGLKRCALFTSGSKVVDMIGRLHVYFQSRKIFVGYGESVFEATSQKEPILFNVF